MSKYLKDLKVQLNTPNISTLRADNAFFLQGEQPVKLSGTWQGWKIVGQVVTVLGFTALFLVGGLVGHSRLWNSSAAIQTEGTITNYEGGDISYNYTVQDQQYKKVEGSSRNYYSSEWDQGKTPYPVFYLNFLPSISKLKHNVETDTIDVFTSIMLLTFTSAIPIFGLYTIRSTENRNILFSEATHLLQGEIYHALESKGSVDYFYRTTSPITGEQISGSFYIGKLNPNFGYIRKGSIVAILYKDDKMHGVI